MAPLAGSAPGRGRGEGGEHGERGRWGWPRPMGAGPIASTSGHGSPCLPSPFFRMRRIWEKELYTISGFPARRAHSGSADPPDAAAPGMCWPATAQMDPRVSEQLGVQWDALHGLGFRVSLGRRLVCEVRGRKGAGRGHPPGRSRGLRRVGVAAGRLLLRPPAEGWATPACLSTLLLISSRVDMAGNLEGAEPCLTVPCGHQMPP